MATASDDKPIVGFTIGEPGGIGPQLLLTILQGDTWKDEFIPVLYAPRRVIEQWRSFLGFSQLRYHVIRQPAEARPDILNLIDLPLAGEVRLKTTSPENGAIARLSFTRAVEDAQKGLLKLLVTLPVDKATFYNAGQFPYRGHTEYLSHLYPGKTLMVMVGERLRVAVATEHIPLSRVAETLTPERVEQVILQFIDALRIDFAIPKPRIAVLALNPHAGDGGIIGTEEETWLKPLIARLSQEHRVGGPYPADGFFGARHFYGVDGIVALYHDQGLIPFKLLEEWEGYQYTVGLPFIRTAPDHGVAYDKVGTPDGSISSLSAAIWEGLLILQRRKNTAPYLPSAASSE
jgi:4-hydroxythreonine-4-phosphate dehydrogenase